jgi:hypothetical protein
MLFVIKIHGLKSGGVSCLAHLRSQTIYILKQSSVQVKWWGRQNFSIFSFESQLTNETTPNRESIRVLSSSRQFAFLQSAG